MAIACWMKFSDDELQHFGRGTKWPQFQIQTQTFCNKLFTDIWYIKLYDEFIYHIWLQQYSGHELTTLNRWANQNVVFPIIWGVVRISIVRFHMTSRRPYLCTKQWIGGHVCVQKNPVGVKLFSHVKIFFNSKQFAKQLLLTTWLETIYQTAPIQKYRFTAKSLHDHCAISSIVQFLGTKKQCKFKILDGKQGVLRFFKNTAH